jgi:ABC-type lipoprotein release transport system permease subunit
LGIALCVALIVTSTSVGGGFSYSSNQLVGVLTSSPYLIVLNKSSVSVSDSRLSNSTVEAIDHPNVVQICPQLFLDANAELNDSSEDYSLVVRGAELDVFTSMKGLSLNLTHPNLLTGAFVGCVLANELGVETGDNITLTWESVSLTLECLQIFESHQNHDLEIIISLLHARQLAPAFGATYSLVELKLNDPTQADSTAAALEITVPGVRVLPARAMSSYIVLATAQLFAILWALGLVISLVMAIGVYFVMQNTVEESVFEIAVLRALGSPRRNIITLILVQALLIGTAAGILGVAIGVVLADSISIFVTYILAGTYIAPYYVIINLVAAAIAAIISGVIGGLLPAYRAASIPPGTILQ